jgi:hypothetical protein
LEFVGVDIFAIVIFDVRFVQPGLVALAIRFIAFLFGKQFTLRSADFCFTAGHFTFYDVELPIAECFFRLPKSPNGRP